MLNEFTFKHLADAFLQNDSEVKPLDFDPRRKNNLIKIYFKLYV